MKYLFSFLILAMIPTLALSLRVHKSYQQQYYMLSDFNSNDFSREIDYENIIENYPNISITTIALSSIKAEYYFSRKKFDDAINIFKRGIKPNPYIGRSEARLADMYFTYRYIEDSAIYYADKAYQARPLNSKHFLVYLKSLATKNEIDKLDEAIENNIDQLKKINAQDQYLPSSMYFYLSTVHQYKNNNKQKYDSIARQAQKLFPKSQKIKIISNFIIYDKDSVQKGLELDEKARVQLENKNYEKAFDLFSQSVSFWPNNEYSIQQAGISAYLIQNYTKSIDYLEKLLEIAKPIDGITELYLYDSYKKINDSLNACKYYNKLILLKPNLVDKNIKGCD